MTGIYWLDPRLDPETFPDPELALKEPNGLLAAGGDLSEARLIAAYRRGIFPWFSEGEPILWWSPDPRSVLFPTAIKISRSLRKRIKKREFRVTLDDAFPDVIAACAMPRKDRLGTWITDELRNAYIHLHEIGVAHSVECWRNDELVGGLYGVSLGRVFFGESMFSRATDASKVALVYLACQLTKWGYRLIDCQVASNHLASLGATNIPRREFLDLIEDYLAQRGPVGRWQFDTDIEEAVLHANTDYNSEDVVNYRIRKDGQHE